MSAIRSICVYCGSSSGRSASYGEAGLALGRSIGSNGFSLVYGGGSRGIMGAVAQGVSEAGGKVVGIIPQFLVSKEAPDGTPGLLDEVHVVETMHQRKQMMFERSDAFVALPGGLGTLEEIVEVMTWAQLGRHRKPIVFANIDGFWAPMLTLIEHMRAENFIHAGNLVRPLVVDRAQDVVPAILAEAPPGGGDGDEAVIARL